MKFKLSILLLMFFSKIVLGQTNSNNKKEILKNKDSMKQVLLQKLLEQRKQRNNKYLGKKIPSFKLSQLNGNIIDSNTLKGKPSIINFWFIGCKHCEEETPFLNKIKEYFGNKVNFVSITPDKSNDVKSYLENIKFDFNHIINGEEYISKFNFFSYPKTIILDKNLTIIKIENKITSEKKIMNKLIKIQKR